MNHITDFHTAVNAINARTIENLMDIDWGAVTNGYSIDGIARFLIAIQDNTLREPIKRAIEQHYFLYYGSVRSLNDVLWEVDNFIAVYDESYLTPCNVPIKSRSNVQQIGTASTPLPVELQTDEAIKRFERAEKAGIIERTQTGYRKKGISKAMLAYFLQKVFLQDSRANDLFPDKELSTIFNESRLGAAVTALINNRDGKPKGYKQIDDLFVD
mgnify:FL=1